MNDIDRLNLRVSFLEEALCSVISLAGNKEAVRAHMKARRGDLVGKGLSKEVIEALAKQEELLFNNISAP